jgi:ketosteroid isomerase-like protein
VQLSRQCFEGENMKPEEFVSKYEAALATQDWQRVSPYIHEDACVTFSNGNFFEGKAEVQQAYEKNFRLIQEENFSIFDIHWVRKTENFAVYTFGFQWQGLINGKMASGSGRGTSVIICEDENWLLLSEHLGPPPS